MSAFVCAGVHVSEIGSLLTVFTAESSREAFPHLLTAVFCPVTLYYRGTAVVSTSDYKGPLQLGLTNEESCSQMINSPPEKVTPCQTKTFYVIPGPQSIN